MALCTDKSLTYLNDLGYNVVRLPRKGLDPLDVLGRDGRSLERLGRLDQLWISRQPVPQIGPPQSAAHVNGQATGEMSMSMGLKVLNGVLKSIGAGPAKTLSLIKTPTLSSSRSVMSQLDQ